MNQIESLNQPNNGIIKRPTAITVICVFGFIGVGLSIPMIFSEFARQIGSWFPSYAGFVTTVNLICMVGLWRTKKWGLYIYSVLVLINQIVLITKEEWNVLILIVQGIIILIALYHLQPSTRPTYNQVALYLKRKAWAIIVAYMVGIHNFYREEQKDPIEIVYTIDNIEEQENAEPED
ncbi:hypothetical protein GCM10027275_43400 [Rhabdobacter roseus]|uniref:Glucose dehydrogenase n=1 Tax=Rhabdobacter roseus TaxID=1655419 RepID=A0A840TZ78_9BACT|nr:hypothetical protein [Rhabdobacter roseus]MBB5286603.1 glucose dehydrogenase [Rhabdobacter roseus]